MLPIALDTFLPYRLAVLTHRLSRQLAAIYEAPRHGLSTPQWRVMAAVAEVPGRTAQDIVRLTPMEKATVSRAVSALIVRGFLERQADASDGRASRLALTAAGTAVYAAIAPQILAVEAGVIGAGAKARMLNVIAEIEAGLAAAPVAV